MTPKLNIDSGFNVFDEWGTYRGKFVPTGGGLLEWIIATIILIVIGIALFLLYILVRMTIEGFKALFKRDWLYAFVYFLPVLIIAYLVVANQISISQEIARKKAMEDEIRRFVILDRIQSVTCDGWFGYDVVNWWDKPVTVSSSLSLLSKPYCPNGYMEHPIIDFPNRGRVLNPGERVTIYSYWTANECVVYVESKTVGIRLCPKPSR